LFSFQINSFGAAVVLSTLLMGALGVFVIAPIACIEFSWNFMAKHLLFYIPLINPWQALLVYLAFASIVYLLGWIRIEIQTGSYE
jgi:hypothetical protein